MTKRDEPTLNSEEGATTKSQRDKMKEQLEKQLQIQTHKQESLQRQIEEQKVGVLCSVCRHFCSGV